MDALYAPRRTVLDALLVDAAEEAGAQVPLRAGGDRPGPRSAPAGSSAWSLRDHRGATWTERARLVVGADGRASLVAARVAAPTVAAGAHAAAYVYGYWPAADLDGYHWYYGDGAVRRRHPDERRPGVRVRRRPAGGARRARCATAGPAAMQRATCWRGSTARLADLVAGAAVGPVRFFRGMPARLRRAHGPGWALVGDAGWWKDPLSTHGITDALRDAELLAGAVVAGAASERADADRPLPTTRRSGTAWPCRCIRSSTASPPTSGTLAEARQLLRGAVLGDGGRGRGDPGLRSRALRGATPPDSAAAGRARFAVGGAMRVEIDLLGGFAVRVDGRAVPAEEWRRRQAAALVKLLALAPRRTLHREQVIDALWPDTGIDDAGAAAAQGRALRPPRARRPERAGPRRGHRVAVPRRRRGRRRREFERCARQALAALDRGAPRAAAAAAAAADLWAGDLLPDDPYEAWLEDPRDRLRQLHQEVLRRAGRWGELALADPADEEASLALARQLADSGDRRGAALRQLERLERALRGELGVTPGPRGRRAARRAARQSDAPESSAAAGESRRWAATPSSRRIDRLIAAASAGEGRTLFVSGPAGIGKTAVLRWLDRRAEERGLRVGVGTAAAIEGAWPYAPVLEALADLCRRHPALLDGLADEYRVEIEGALRGTSPEWAGESRHQRLFVSAAELLRLAPPAAARCSSSTTPTTPTRPACGCCTTCRAPRSASGS